MIPSIIQLKQDVRELQGRVDDLQAIVEIQQGVIDLLTMRGDLMHAHVENLIERVYAMEQERAIDTGL